MFKALVIKELRESAGVVALAVLGLVYAFSALTGMGLLPWQGTSIYAYPFLRDELGFYFGLCIGGLAVALAMKQTAWEIGQGTQYFLLHRPVSRKRVFTSKLMVGLFWVLLLSAALILIYAWWAATPGHFMAPFYWSMTMPAWQQWTAMPIIYVGAFLSGIRPGRWFGTRLAPLLAAIFVAIIACNAPWLWLSMVVSLLAMLIGTISIFYYARQRDY